MAERPRRISGSSVRPSLSARARIPESSPATSVGCSAGRAGTGAGGALVTVGAGGDTAGATGGAGAGRALEGPGSLSGRAGQRHRPSPKTRVNPRIVTVL